jgi:hypothetical protein
MKYLNINTIFLSILTLFLGYGVLKYYSQAKDPYEIPTGALPVPIQVGKNKLIVSKTGDASMSTESRRRKAIISNHAFGNNYNFWNKDSNNGSMESFFLTSICPLPPPVIYDGGNAGSNFTYILDGMGGYLVDAGYADTNVCDI